MSEEKENLNERVVLNVGGTRFETYATTLASYPDSLLGAMFSSRNRHMRRFDANGEFFFDRDPEAFRVVLNFYRTGKVLPNPGISQELLEEEFEYFQIPVKVEDEGRVFTWGRGEYGQLGHGDRSNTHIPKVVAQLQGLKIVHLSLGTSHSAAITADHRVYTWGYGGDGRLGHGDEADQLAPRVLEALSGMRTTVVVCGELHTAALTASGRVLTWGLGKDGRLGHCDRESHFYPAEVQALRSYHVSQVSCGGLHTAALTADGEVLTWGLGKDGRLGHGSEVDQLAPHLVEMLVQDKVSQVVCGGHHTAALTEDGVVFTWGFDDDGRLGHGAPGHQYTPRQVEGLRGEPMSMVAAGCWHSAALSRAGAVYTWGSCKSGQLGQAHKNSVPSPRVVMQDVGGGVVMVACGTAHTAALTASGELYTWGKHDDGRLGTENTTDQVTPQLVSSLVGHQVKQVVCGVYDTAVLTS